MTKLREVLTQFQECIEAPEPKLYPKLSVKLYGKGVVLDTSVDGSTLKMKRHQLAQAGQVILSEIWGKRGAIGIVPPEGDGALCTSHFFLFDIREDRIDRRWLQAIFAANYLQAQLDAEAKGTTGYAAVRPKILLSCEIPLPPVTEQRRLVERIEQLSEQIQEALTLRQLAANEAETLRTAIVSALFERDSTIWMSVQDAVSPQKGAVRSGPFGSQLLHEEFTESGVAAIGTRDVQTNKFKLQSRWFVSPEKFQQFNRYQVFPNDVLCTIVGASIGRFCVVPQDVPLAFTTKHIQALTLDSAKADSRFVSSMLNFHRRCRESLFSQVEGSAQPSLNAGKILATSLPLPKIEIQQRIVAQLDALQTKIDALKQSQFETTVELNALLPSVLDKAFRGEL